MTLRNIHTLVELEGVRTGILMEIRDDAWSCG
jgi:hypothetical protein